MAGNLSVIYRSLDKYVMWILNYTDEHKKAKDQQSKQAIITKAAGEHDGEFGDI